MNQTKSVRPLLQCSTVPELATRIMAEYHILPGLALTEAQVRRLWQTDEPRSAGVLEALVDVGFLRKTAMGFYVRNL
jgi:hypothetical protein